MSSVRDPRRIEALDVHVGDEAGADHHVGRLERTEHGAAFRYLPAVRGPAVGFCMPVCDATYTVHGVNLPPFFAGLLPEGLRFHALVRGLKTSADDLFSMLVAVGGDTVGAVSVALPGEAPVEHEPAAKFERPEDVSFAELLETTLQFDASPKPVDSHAIAGVQPKVSAGMVSFPVRATRAGSAWEPCILKLEPTDLPCLVANERFFMTLARDVGLDVPDVRSVTDRDGRPGLLVARFDRGRNRAGRLAKFAQEDACQLLDRYPADKYRLSLRDFAAALEVCTAPAPERLRLLQLLAFSYAIANGDLHAKNLSVRTARGLTRLSPGYDLLSTLPYGDDSMALPIEGRDKRWTRADLVAFGERIGVRRAATERMLDALLGRLRRRLADDSKPLDAIGFDDRRTRHLERTILERCAALDRRTG